MPRFFITFTSLFFLFSGAVFASAFAEETTMKSLEQYYLDGIYEYVDRNYTTATEQFEALSHNYPYSERTRKSLIMEAFLNYINDEVAKIDGVFEVFSRLFPDDEEMPYMRYIKAMGYYSQVKDDTRSLDAMIKSRLLFEDLIVRHPDSKYAVEAKKKADFLDKMMQLNEVKIGEFYFQRRDYIGAMRRFTGIFQKYKQLQPEIEERTLCRIIVLSKMLNMDDNAEKYDKLLKEKYKDTKCKY